MKKTGSQPDSAAHETNHQRTQGERAARPQPHGLRAEHSLRPQREDGARQMAQPRQQDAGIEDGNVDICVTMGDEVSNRAGQTPKYHPALQ